MVQQHGKVNSVLVVDMRGGNLCNVDDDGHVQNKDSPSSKDVPFIMDKMA